MAEYGKYTDINEGQLSSDATSLQGKLKTAQGELSSFQGTLTDDTAVEESLVKEYNGENKIFPVHINTRPEWLDNYYL